jgi:hypothetical protein
MSHATDMARQVLTHVFVLMRVVSSHGSIHQVTVNAAHELHELVAQAQVVVLQFVRGALFSDQQLVPLNWDELEASLEVSRALDNLGAQEISLNSALTPDALILVGELLSRGAAGPYQDADSVKIKGFAIREIPSVSWGEEQEEIDEDLFALSQIALAIKDASVLSLERGWDWQQGGGIVRRLEQACEANFGFASRALELTNEPWTPHRRAVYAAFDVYATMSHLGIERPLRRVAAHVTLGLTFCGYDEHEGMTLEDANEKFLEVAIKSPAASTTGMPPHRLRCTTVSHLFEQGDPSRWFGFMELIRLCYELEYERVPKGVDFVLTKADLMALAAQEMGSHYPPVWVRALISLYGDTPPGAYVRMPDGRVGVIMGDNPQTGMLQVIVSGQVVDVRPPVTLISSAQAHGII